MSRVLITGAAGSIGRVLVAGLTERGYAVRGLDRRPLVPADPALDLVVGDCADPATVADALAGVDAVVHLVGIPSETDLPTAMAAHVLTTGTVLEAMRDRGVRRLVYASSNHAVGWHGRTERLPTDVRPRPDTYYGVAKVAAEALISLHADRYGVSAACLRIGSFGPRPQTRRHLATWLSPGDAVRLVDTCLSAPDLGYRVLFGISANTRAWWDLGPALALGYQPVDDAERYATQILATTASAQDDHDGRRVGGDFTGPDYDRPAFDRPTLRSAGADPEQP